MTFQEVKELSTKLTEEQKLGLLCELLDQGVVDQDSPIDTLQEYIDEAVLCTEKVSKQLPTEPEEDEPPTE